MIHPSDTLGSFHLEVIVGFLRTSYNQTKY